MIATQENLIMRTSLSKIRLTISIINFISEIDREGSEVHGEVKN